jgi:hypothetical protein
MAIFVSQRDRSSFQSGALVRIVFETNKHDPRITGEFDDTNLAACEAMPPVGDMVGF